MLVPTVMLDDPNVPIAGACILTKKIHIVNTTKEANESDDMEKNKTIQTKGKPFTFTTATEAALEASYVRLSTVLSNLIPSEFAKILIPLSFVETANSIPSLLNLIDGEACRILRPTLVEKERDY